MPKGRKNLIEKEAEKVDTGVPQPEVKPTPEKIAEELAPPQGTGQPPNIEPETISIPKAEWENVQKTLEMLKSVADKGRVYNYESANNKEKKLKKVKLSNYDGGLIIAWEVQKDELLKHPITGATVGENQAIQIKILMPNGDITSKDFSSYVSFSDARYNERAECEVVGTAEDYNGKITWTLALPDGRHITILPAFVN